MFLPRGSSGERTLKLTRRLEPLTARRGVRPGIEMVPLGPIQVRLHRPPASVPKPTPALLWVHGGGYIGGNPAQDDRLCQLLAKELGIVVAAVKYRRAPEHPFPTPLNDCHDGLAWLASREDVDPQRVAVGGASAGGGLGCALALLAHERGVVRPVFQLISYPMIDDRTATRTDIDETGFRLWSNKSNRFGWQCYLGMSPGSPGVSGLAAPSRYEDFAGVAPAWIGIGKLDLFYDETIAYAARLRAAGVPCEVYEVPGAFHGFDALRPKASITIAYRNAQLGALAAGLGLDY